MKKIITSSAIIALCASGFALADASLNGSTSLGETASTNNTASVTNPGFVDLNKFLVKPEFKEANSLMPTYGDDAKFLIPIYGEDAKFLMPIYGDDAKFLMPELYTEMMKSTMKNCTDSIKKAVEAKDFSEFKDAAKNSPMESIDTQEEFDKLVAMHEEMKKEVEKKITSVKEKAKTIILNLKKSVQKDLKIAIVAGNYEEFIAALPEGHVFATKITEDDFAELKELVDAKKAGDTKKVKEILKTLDLTKKEKNLLKKIIR